MLFNSLEFIVFFIALFVLYWFAFKQKTKQQNILLLISSYVFYAWANWKVLLLLIVSTLVFYGLGIAISESEKQKRKSLLTIIGIVLGISGLVYFKYANFFITSFQSLFESIGMQMNWHTLHIMVPIGISFYTFRLLSYVIDINRGKYEPIRDLIAFSTYVAFFPCILSGPIDRPNTLIPQLQTPRVFNYSLTVDGCRQILWGLFKKIVVADNLAGYVNRIFESYQEQSGSVLLLGAVFFMIQMYADFSGYSDMAIGIGKLLGLKVTLNFNYPFFAQNIADFWRRWHISLTSWLTDYVFMPLNIKWRNWSKWGMILAIIIDFIICGLWHGSNWTFVFWGLYHGLLFIPLILSGQMFKKTKIETCRWGFPTMKVFGRMLLTFFLVALGSILFRSDSIGSAWNYIVEMFSSSPFSTFDFGSVSRPAVFCLTLLIIEWMGRENQYAIEKLCFTKKWYVRWGFYYAITCMIFLFGGGEQQFIYFQF
jgi:D-alanyl-lipoteichoic acid acyltransferase DltB (MBOAT superfamily)